MFKVKIKPLVLANSEISWKWRNDPEIWKYTGSRPDFIITPEIERNWIKKVISETNSKRFSINVNELYIGNIQLTNITEFDAEYHIFIGDKKFWGKGISFDATLQILLFAKKKLKLELVYLYVKNENISAIKLYQRVGFNFVENENKMIIKLNELSFEK
jgi:RimJ/RimL family protein N-acetyltransferase